MSGFRLNFLSQMTPCCQTGVYFSLPSVARLSGELTAHLAAHSRRTVTGWRESLVLFCPPEPPRDVGVLPVLHTAPFTHRHTHLTAVVYKENDRFGRCALYLDLPARLTEEQTCWGQWMKGK